MENKIDLENLTPSQTVKLLDKFIIGQDKAKKSVAVALRNRTRRKKLPPELRDEIMPKNLILIGPTGVGKTEIARRIAQLTGAPFIKVEATKYTEIGYVGRNVEQIIRDFMNLTVSQVRKELMDKLRSKVKEKVDLAILAKLMPTFENMVHGDDTKLEIVGEPIKQNSSAAKLKELYDQKKFDDKIIEIEIIEQQSLGDMINIPGMEDMGISIGGIFPGMPQKKKKRRVKVSEAKRIIEEQELDKLIDNDQVIEIAKDRVENLGIVFIDEIDKIIGGSGSHGPDVSREGVQRDLLPIVEGTTVSTKYGLISTDHILFIAAGAFSFHKPSDLIPELQGRFPIRVELSSLSAEDFQRILTEPENALLKQYMALLKTENVELVFKDDAVWQLASIASEINSKSDNIGARRLHTVLEYLLEEISFNAPDQQGSKIVIDSKYVQDRLYEIIEDKDIMKYIL